VTATRAIVPALAVAIGLLVIVSGLPVVASTGSSVDATRAATVAASGTVVPSATPGAAELAAAEASLATGAGPMLAPGPHGLPSPASTLDAVRSGRSDSERPATPLGWQLLGSLESRYAGSMAYDASDGYVLEFGGDPDAGSTWTYSNGTWTNLTLTVDGAPPERAAAAMTYDAALGEIVLFGGFSFATAAGYTLNDTWEYHAGTWTNLTGSAGTAPPSRYFAGLAYDANDSAAVLFGGLNNASATLGGTWEFLGGHWSNVTANQTASPASSAAPAFASDAADGDAVLFGGGTSPAPFQNQTWTFAGNLWTNVTGAVGAAPAGRAYAGLSADSNDSGVLLFGGYGTPPNGSDLPEGLTDTWLFSGGSWSRVPTGPSAPSPRLYESMTDDPAVGGVLLYSGYDQFNVTVYGDTWGFAAGAWTLLGSSATPTPRNDPSLAYDSTTDQVILFGGSGLNDTWSYSAGNWTLLAPAHAPTGRMYATLTDDPSDGELVLFGGETVTQGAPNIALLNDTWVFANGTWTNLTATAHGPVGRIAASSAYDSTAGLVVLFGGENRTVLLNDTWTFHAGRWTEVGVGDPAPPSRYGASLADDPDDSGLLLFGGYGCVVPSDPALLCNDTWTYSAGAWTSHATSTAPSFRDFAGLVDDPAFKADVLEGGIGFPCVVSPNSTECTEVLQNDTWEYRSGAWTNLTGSVGVPPQGGLGAAFVEDGVDGYAFLFGAYGTGSGVAGASWWSLSPGASTPLVVGTPSASVNPVAVGNLTNLTVKVSGGAAPYEVSWSGLPTGCATANSTTLACTPSAAGTFPVRVSASDADGDLAQSPALSLNVTLITYPIGSVTIAPVVTTMNITSSRNLTAHALDTAGHALAGVSYLWSVTPVSLAALNQTSGPSVKLTANRTVGGITVKVNATYEGNWAISTESITIVEATGVPLNITAFTADPSPALVGSNVTFTTVVVGGTLPYTYTYAGLPQGCSSTNVANLTCTPTKSGPSTVSVEVTDQKGGRTNRGLKLQVTSSTTTANAFPTTLELVAIGVVVLVVALVVGFLLARRMRPSPPPTPPSAGAAPPGARPPPPSS
jgi:hypothetical protein